jgi:hypothetical protein
MIWPFSFTRCLQDANRRFTNVKFTWYIYTYRMEQIAVITVIFAAM